jgi:N,N'-diacetyllegionaminate synthase
VEGGGSVKIVAEVGLSHCGCLGTAIAYVQAIAAAGADAAKFQDHLGDKCSRFRPGTEKDFPQDRNRQSYWRRTGFSFEEFARIAEACTESALEYIVSPFSMEAFERQERLDPDRWKIASSKVNDHQLIDACVATGKPVILSSGMSTLAEIKAAAALVPHERLTVLQCVTMYPTPAMRSVWCV